MNPNPVASNTKDEQAPEDLEVIAPIDPNPRGMLLNEFFAV